MNNAGNCKIPFFQSDGDLLQDLDGLLMVLQLGLDKRRELAHLFYLQREGSHALVSARKPLLLHCMDDRAAPDSRPRAQ